MGEEKREFEDREHHIAPDRGSGADGRGNRPAISLAVRADGSRDGVQRNGERQSDSL